MTKAYFIADFFVTGVGYNALNKSRSDLFKIYLSLGIKPLIEKETVVSNSKVKDFSSNNEILSQYMEEVILAIDEKCQENEFLFMDFPFALKFAGYSKIVSYAKSKGIKIIMFVHDLDGIRFRQPVENIMDSSCLDMAYTLITASKEMDETLINTLKVNSNIRRINHNYWDYLVDDIDNENLDGLICFAGNLAKSSFISKLPDELVNEGFNLYGKGMAANYKGTFKGQYNPEELVSVLDGKFGLVWDGKSATTCNGNYGDYLTINTSHKFGLYMATKKPVIVWDGSTLANFVLDKKIGISVPSLFDIAPALENLNAQAYFKMRENINEIRKDIITGKHLANIILESMKPY